MEYTLVIVDMQPLFVAAKCDRIAKRIIDLIKQAKSESAPIVVLEYSYHGDTRSDINDALNGYPKLAVRTKHEDDGSIQVLEAKKHLKVDTDHIKVCGVNLGYCVKSTALGLKDKGKNVSIVRKACHQSKYNGSKKPFIIELIKNGVTIE